MAICAYGDCHDELRGRRVSVTISEHAGEKERKQFCSERHAGLWLERWAVIRNSVQPKEG